MRAAILVLLVGAASSFVEQSEWNNFKLKHAKSYANPIEEFYRMKVYADNKAYIEQHMKEHAEGKHTFTVALNKFADLTTEEWSSQYKGLKMGSTTPHKTHQVTGKALPSSQDWRQSGAVTPVKDQGQCGSCWSFSATGSLEGAWVIAGNSLTSLSEQQIMDCSWAYGNQGCNGGWMDQAFDYIKANGGVQTEASYPYTAADGTCQATPPYAATVSGYTDIAGGDEDALADAVANVGPVAVAIDASHISFQFYSGGIYNESRCFHYLLDHGVLAVGYGDGYWLVKNSWGTSWGDSGYIKMTRDGSNQCGIATQASYPSV
ncbi:Digestive cysteine proteinase 2 [Amphibalanus amphitrite]|uniref:Digestive cysteine proteinase 2 n=1 Tax=Amphibalanus amphitrite TaxID=1232801 RepID=A0A6A4VAT9_AMPAM|nr:procathepsin L-like [Amphibalanus amphitrite]KAF0290773.1 Digestive cysteine proteinase 2 [Amphibalanus amphitrite]